MSKTGVAEKTKSRSKTALPPMYRVVLLNDDYTTMDFVVSVLLVIFRKSHEEANQIMLSVHKNGRGVCGVYPLEIAEHKVRLVEEAAAKNEFPLKAIIEVEEQ